MVERYRRFLVITSVHPPTAAVVAYAGWPIWNVVVVGDAKSPSDWACPGVRFLSLDTQLALFGRFAAALPRNTYVRKMLGYVLAAQEGATHIFETDDDNLPYSEAPRVLERAISESITQWQRLQTESGWVNIYREFGAPRCWPRGFPLQRVLEDPSAVVPAAAAQEWATLQFLADRDPDVDAIYRMTVRQPVFFERERWVLLAEGTRCPSNSQATLWKREVFALLFLPVGVPDRVTDILRGYMALACLWKCGMTMGFGSPIVYQERNDHNLSKDFAQEIALYTQAENWNSLLKHISGASVAEAYRDALRLFVERSLVPAENLALYDIFVGLLHT